MPSEVGRQVRQVGILKITETSADKSKAVILASNEESDLELCKTTIYVEDYLQLKTRIKDKA